MSSKPTNSAPAVLAASADGPLLAKTRTLTVLPLPCGSGTVPRTIWSDCFGSTPRRKARSMVSLNLAFGNLARTSTAALRGYNLLASTASAALLYLLLGMFDGAVQASVSSPAFGCVASGHDFDAHAAGGAGDGADGGFFATGIHVVEFQFDDLQDLFPGDFPDFFLVGGLGPGSDAGGLFEQDRGGRRLGDEGEGFVLEHGDDDGNDHAGLALGGGVEFLAESHDVDPLLTEGGADRRGRVGLSAGNLQFDLSNNFLCHKNSLAGGGPMGHFPFPTGHL